MISEKNTKQEIFDEYKRLVSEAKSQNISLPPSATGINAKNTKADILTAIQAIQQAISSNTETPAKKAAPVSAPAPEAPEPPEKIADKPETSPVTEEENDLIYLKPEIKDEIEALNTAKALRKKEYENLLAIEQELVRFVTVINQNKNHNLHYSLLELFL